jgi:hypothetical protein
MFPIVLFSTPLHFDCRGGQVIDPNTFLRADFAALDTYTPVKPFHVLAAEIGVPAERLIKLDANEVGFACRGVLCALCCVVQFWVGVLCLCLCLCLCLLI